MFTDGTAPKEESWDPETPWTQDERFLYGADLFDQRYYWEAHEAWEALWHFAAPDTNPHRLLQSLIQYAAAALKHHMGHTQGAERLYQRATERLKVILQSEATPYRGIHIRELITRMENHLQGGPWPTLPMDAP